MANSLTFHVHNKFINIFRIEQRDAIRAPLNLQHYALGEHKIDKAKVPTKENHKQVWELFDASTCVGHGFRVCFNFKCAQ